MLVFHHIRQTSTTAFVLLAISTQGLCKGDKVTAPFVDQATNITFQRFFGAKSGFAFGIALPEAPNSSFIGQLTFPLKNGAGWGGWSLTGDMEGPLLMAAWSPDGTNVISSFRQARNEDDNPPEVTGAFSVRPIAEGTFVNSSFLSYTFLCEGCLDASMGLGAAATAGTAEMGWALGSKAVRNPETSAGILAFHDEGEGGFDAKLSEAKSAEFDKWAALAGPPVPPPAAAQPFAPDAGDDSGDSGDESGDDSDSDDEDD